MDRFEKFVGVFGRGKQGKLIMETYIGYKKYVNAWHTEIGQHIMEDLMKQLNTLASKLENGNTDNLVYAQYTSLKKYADSVADKILGYQNMQNQIEKRIKDNKKG